MNREQRRREMQRSGLKPGVGVVETPLTTKVGIDTRDKKVVIEYSITLNHLKMPPEEAVIMGKHLIMAARNINPDLPWPKETT